jgi:hypothetical protein
MVKPSPELRFKVHEYSQTILNRFRLKIVVSFEIH